MLKIAGCFRSKNQMPTLKTDGQNCNVLLLGLRNEFDLQYIVDNSMVAEKTCRHTDSGSFAIFMLSDIL